MFYYYNKEEILKGKLFLIGIEDKKLTIEELKKENKLEFYKDAVIYEGETYFTGYPIYIEESNTIRQATRIELINLGLNKLNEGEYIENGEIKYVPYDIELDYAKPKFNNDTHIWEETATEEEKKKYEEEKIINIGIRVTNILFSVLEKGFEVTVLDKKHIQSLSDSKRKALNEQITAINLATELEEPIQQIPWPFKDDGTDTVIIPVENFKKLVLESHKYGQDCYIAAEYLKARKDLNVNINDFMEELNKVRTRNR